ncbi:MraY family glycosyltransferase [Oceanihabitans sediminis]|uniref:MraY family glycosyltransferase n=1 Tax=Oceanihabitans sediminis TaxID=1812012 RepID=UPI003A94514A
MDLIPTNHAELMAFLSEYKIFSAAIILLYSLVVTMIIMPRIVIISKKKNLTAQTNSRTSHKGVVPTLGGVGVFTGLILTVNFAAILFADYEQYVNLSIFNILTLLLLLVGITDDLMNTSPRKKFLYQLLISLVFIFGTNIHIDSFFGLLGIHDIPNVLASVFSAFVIVLLINAYNLIDGIDGLAGLVGVIVSGFMALAFYLSGNFFYSLISLSLVGALISFLIYNFSRRMKIFLGDTGSMVVGFVLAYQVVLYLSLANGNSEAFVFKNAPIFALALVSYPLFDTLRVMCLRLLNKKSPFLADRNHIHHRLIDLGLAHKYASLAVAFYTLLVTIVAVSINSLPINIAFIIMLVVVTCLLLLPFAICKKEGAWSLRFPKA